MSTFLAVDFGAGSGRVIAGVVNDGQLVLDELHRFSNRQIRIGRHLYWDFPALFEEMKEGLRRAAAKYTDILSIGIDTWGVDFGLVDAAGNLMGNPVCYRDAFTEHVPEEVFGRIDVAAHYAETGIQVMPINTMFQLYALKKENKAWLQEARHLLFMPDLFAYYLTGVPGNEYTIASTSEMLDAERREWSRPLVEGLGLPAHLFEDKLLMPGSVRGTLCPDVAAEVGLPASVKIISVGSHDTASAVYAVPFRKGKVSAFLSSGTWSLLGIVMDEPLLTEDARVAGFTNEGGVGGNICFLQNITGLWILQCLVRQWTAKGLQADYDFLIAEAEKVTNVPCIDVDAPDFRHPDDMEAAIVSYCRSRGLTVPVTQGEYVRCVLQSLAVRYREGLAGLNALLPRPVECLHIIGGGCRNRLLNRLTEEALGIPVISGPVEATAVGNILVQAEACGVIENKNDVHAIN